MGEGEAETVRESVSVVVTDCVGVADGEGVREAVVGDGEGAVDGEGVASATPEEFPLAFQDGAEEGAKLGAYEGAQLGAYEGAQLGANEGRALAF